MNSKIKRKVDTYGLELVLLTISLYELQVPYPRRSGLVTKSHHSRPISTIGGLGWGGGCVAHGVSTLIDWNMQNVALF